MPEIEIYVAAAVLSCGHIKVWKPSNLFRKQAHTNCPRCRKPREIKARTVELISVS